MDTKTEKDDKEIQRKRKKQTKKPPPLKKKGRGKTEAISTVLHTKKEEKQLHPVVTAAIDDHQTPPPHPPQPHSRNNNNIINNNNNTNEKNRTLPADVQDAGCGSETLPHLWPGSCLPNTRGPSGRWLGAGATGGGCPAGNASPMTTPSPSPRMRSEGSSRCPLCELAPFCPVTTGSCCCSVFSQCSRCGCAVLTITIIVIVIDVMVVVITTPNAIIIIIIKLIF